MPQLVYRIVSPHQRIELNHSAPRFFDLKLTLFKGAGLATGNPTLFLRLENEALSMPRGNVGDRIPLIFRGDGVGKTGTFGIQVTSPNGNFWDSCTMLDVKIENFDGTAATFDSLDMVFTFRDSQPQFQNLYLSQLEMISLLPG